MARQRDLLPLPAGGIGHLAPLYPDWFSAGVTAINELGGNGRIGVDNSCTRFQSASLSLLSRPYSTIPARPLDLSSSAAIAATVGCAPDYSDRNHTQSVGLGRLSDPAVQNVVAQALREARKLVANIRAFMPVYRSEAGWISVFRAFRLPSPLSRVAAAREAPAPADAAALQAEVHAALDKIAKVAKLGPRAKRQLLKLLPRAEVHHHSGCGTKAAWGRASAAFPELQQGRFC